MVDLSDEIGQRELNDEEMAQEMEESPLIQPDWRISDQKQTKPVLLVEQRKGWSKDEEVKVHPKL